MFNLKLLGFILLISGGISAQTSGVLMPASYPDPDSIINLNLPKQKYKLSSGKIAGWLTLSAVSFIDGVAEGYTFDGRKSFERKYSVDPYGFWGSESWRRVYVDGDPANGHKSWLHKNLGAWDFYHAADDLRKYGYIGSASLLGISFYRFDKSIWHWLLDAGISIGLSIFWKRTGMQWIRN